MSSAISQQNEALAIELHALLRAMDGRTWRSEKATALRERFEHFQDQLRESINSQREEAHRRQAQVMARLREEIGSHLPSPSDAAEGLRDSWNRLSERVHPVYGELSQLLKAEDIHLPDLRPSNLPRKFVHAMAGVLSLVILAAVPSMFAVGIIALAFSVTCWTLEITRRRDSSWNDKLMAKLGKFAHPHEHLRVNSGTWYSTALVVLVLTNSYLVCTIAVAIIGFADPAAAIIGRRFGKIKLVHGRTLEGTLAFIAVGGLTAFLCVLIGFPDLAVGTALLLAFGAATAGSIAELFSLRIDDNFSVPVSSGLAVLLLLVLI